ncbi:MAG: M23 family metallopeptidase [candidate division KSB1 bacterium]|nr:M23 family metallopeptidase [candidate division KSB1 bacterium]MDZ7303608.1 M23 family metallopeptidase [candidate division KSB1 bacterium]MDZ7312845.1 M23 family metallopeptidase [candidate division KSB1 bacterium]
MSKRSLWLRTAVGGAAVFLLLLLFRWLAVEPGLTNFAFRPAQPPADTTTLVMASPAIMIAQTIRYGETLTNLLHKCAVHPDDVVRAITTLQKAFDPRKLRAGDSLRVAVDSSGALQQLIYRPSPEITVRVEREPDGDLESRCDTLALTPELCLLTGEVETTLYQAVMDSGETPELLLAFTDILQWDIDFFIDTQRGDRFRILYEKLFVNKPEGGKEFVRYGRIFAATYEPINPASLNFREARIAAFYFKPENGKAGYFDRDGRSFQKTFLKSPLNYRRITSHFSFGRMHPILRTPRAHTGVDFAAPVGTPVVASANGIVKEIGWHGGYGNCVAIEHKNHFSTLYGHLSRYAENLKKGAPVEQGQVIGYVGATGLATGPHLHYTMYLNGKAINPLKIQPASGDPIPAVQLPEFARHRDLLLLQLGLLPDSVYGPPLWVSRR